MAPSTSQRRRSVKSQQTTPTSATRRIITRSIYKKEKLLLSQESPKKVEKIVESSSFCNEENDFDDGSTISKNINDVCSTPKSEKHKIPEIVTCPPAPKKPKNNTLNQKRRPITFFAHPDIEKFFTFAMRDIKV